MNKGIKYVLSFLTFTSLTGLVIILVLLFTVFNKNYMKDKLEKYDFYTGTYNLIVNDFENNLIQSGVNLEYAKEIVTMDMIKNDFNQIVDGIYDNKEFKLSTNDIKNKLDNVINDILKKNNRVPSQEEKNDIKTLVNTIGSIYEDNVAYSLNTVNGIKKFMPLIKNLLIFAAAFFVVVILVLLLVLVKTDGLVHVIEAIGGTGMFMVLTRIIIGSSFSNILMFNQVFSNTLNGIITSVLDAWVGIGVFFCIIFLGFIIIINRKKKG